MRRHERADFRRKAQGGEVERPDIFVAYAAYVAGIVGGASVGLCARNTLVAEMLHFTGELLYLGFGQELPNVVQEACDDRVGIRGVGGG